MSARRAQLPAYGGRSTISDADMRARLTLVSEQVDYALAEVALLGAAYRRAAQEEADWEGSPDAPETLARPRVARALAAQLAAVGRLRLWAQELHSLQDEIRLRRLVP